MRYSVTGVWKSQKTFPLDVKLCTLASTATKKANHTMANRIQRRTASSRKSEIPTKNTERKVAHRRRASSVSITQAVRPVTHWKTPHKTAKDSGTSGQAKAGGDRRARQTE